MKQIFNELKETAKQKTFTVQTNGLGSKQKQFVSEVNCHLLTDIGKKHIDNLDFEFIENSVWNDSNSLVRREVGTEEESFVYEILHAAWFSLAREISAEKTRALPIFLKTVEDFNRNFI